MSLNMHKNQRNFFHQVDMERGDWDDRLSLTAYPFLEDDSLDGQSALTGIGSLDSFMQKSYQSETMKKILQLEVPDAKLPIGLDSIGYSAQTVFPGYMISSSDWKSAKMTNDNEISEIFRKPFEDRTQDQHLTSIQWIMSVWPVAAAMGVKRAGMMVKVFKYRAYEPGQNIIVEGERGLSFYIIIHGDVTVNKEGIGTVATLSRGKSFGEVALQGKDLRTATITAVTQIEALSLHKVDYDHFVRDIQIVEQRENFKLLRECKSLEKWPRSKIDKMAQAIRRKTFEDGDYVFKQGDKADNVYVIFEGSVDVIKELRIVCKNRWPVSVDHWQEAAKVRSHPTRINSLEKGDLFGELAIIKKIPRSASVVVTGGRAVIMFLDQGEFLHILNSGNQEDSECLKSASRKYIMDDDLIELVNNQISGSGSNSAVYSGSNVIVSNNAKMQSELGRQKTRQILGLAQEPQLSAAAIEIARSEASKPPIMVKFGVLTGTFAVTPKTKDTGKNQIDTKATSEYLHSSKDQMRKSMKTKAKLGPLPTKHKRIQVDNLSCKGENTTSLIDSSNTIKLLASPIGLRSKAHKMYELSKESIMKPAPLPTISPREQVSRGSSVEPHLDLPNSSYGLFLRNNSCSSTSLILCNSEDKSTSLQCMSTLSPNNLSPTVSNRKSLSPSSIIGNQEDKLKNITTMVSKIDRQEVIPYTPAKFSIRDGCKTGSSEFGDKKGDSPDDINKKNPSILDNALEEIKLQHEYLVAAADAMVNPKFQYYQMGDLKRGYGMQDYSLKSSKGDQTDGIYGSRTSELDSVTRDRLVNSSTTNNNAGLSVESLGADNIGVVKFDPSGLTPFEFDRSATKKSFISHESKGGQESSDDGDDDDGNNSVLSSLSGGSLHSIEHHLIDQLPLTKYSADRKSGIFPTTGDTRHGRKKLGTSKQSISKSHPKYFGENSRLAFFEQYKVIAARSKIIPPGPMLTTAHSDQDSVATALTGYSRNSPVFKTHLKNSVDGGHRVVIGHRPHITSSQSTGNTSENDQNSIISFMSYSTSKSEINSRGLKNSAQLSGNGKAQEVSVRDSSSSFDRKHLVHDKMEVRRQFGKELHAVTTASTYIMDAIDRQILGPDFLNENFEAKLTKCQILNDDISKIGLSTTVCKNQENSNGFNVSNLSTPRLNIEENDNDCGEENFPAGDQTILTDERKLIDEETVLKTSFSSEPIVSMHNFPSKVSSPVISIDALTYYSDASPEVLIQGDDNPTDNSYLMTEISERLHSLQLHRVGGDESKLDDVSESIKSAVTIASPRSKYLSLCLQNSITPLSSLVIRKAHSSDMNLAHMGIGDVVGNILSEYLHLLPNVRSLNLTDNNLTDASLPAIIACVNKMTGLVEFNLSKNDLDGDACIALADFLGRNTTLKTLNFSNSDIDDFECQRFISALKENENHRIVNLDMSGNKLGSAENLNFIDNTIETGGEILASFLSSRSCKLESLNLAWNSIRLNSACELALSLGVNQTLQYMDLSDNNLGNDAGIYLGGSLATNKILNTLKISNNNLYGSSIFTIISSVIDNPSLKLLVIDGNPIGQVGTSLISKACLSTFTRIKLSAIGCNITTTIDPQSALPLFADNAKVKFNDSNLAGAYTLELANPYHRATALSLLRYCAFHSSCVIESISHRAENSMKDDMIEIKSSAFTLSNDQLTSGHLKIIEQLDAVIKACSNKELCLKLFHEYDQDGSGELDGLEVIPILKAMGFATEDNEAFNILLQELFTLYDFDGAGTIGLNEFNSFLRNQIAEARSRIRDLTQVPYYAISTSDEMYKPPFSGQLNISIIDKSVYKTNFHVTSHLDFDLVSDICQANFNNDLPTVIYQAFSCSKLRYEEALRIFKLLTNSVQDKASIISKLLPQMINSFHAKKFVILGIHKICRNAYEIMRKVKQDLGNCYGPLVGKFSGYYDLRMTSSTDRMTLSILMNQSATCVRNRRFYATPAMETKKSRVYNNVGDVSQHGNWTCFRNEVLNGSEVELVSSMVQEMTPQDRISFDFIDITRPHHIENLVINDKKFISILINMCLVNPWDEMFCQEYLSYLTEITKIHHYAHNQSDAPEDKKMRLRRLFEWSPEEAHEVGALMDEFYRNILNRNDLIDTTMLSEHSRKSHSRSMSAAPKSDRKKLKKPVGKVNLNDVINNLGGQNSLEIDFEGKQDNPLNIVFSELANKVAQQNETVNLWKKRRAHAGEALYGSGNNLDSGFKGISCEAVGAIEDLNLDDFKALSDDQFKGTESNAISNTEDEMNENDDEDDEERKAYRLQLEAAKEKARIEAQVRARELAALRYKLLHENTPDTNLFEFNLADLITPFNVDHYEEFLAKSSKHKIRRIAKRVISSNTPISEQIRSKCADLLSPSIENHPHLVTNLLTGFIRDTTSDICLLCRHLALLVTAYRSRGGGFLYSIIFGTPIADVVVALFNKLVDIHNFDLVLHLLTPLERACVYCRVGVLNVFNPMKPEGTFEFSLNRPEECTVVKILSFLSAIEPGPNISYTKFLWTRDAEERPGWAIPADWLKDEKEIPKFGIVTLRYQTNDSLNCIADWKRRKMLLYLVNMYEVDFSTDMENADDIEKVLKIYHELGPKYLIPELIKTDGEVWNNVLAKGCGLY